MSSRLSLGAPGVYFHAPEPTRTLTGVRMDVAAFVGVASRGPARVPTSDAERKEGRRRRHSVPVPVESFEEYRRLFGGFEGPGLLPYAVHTFFTQGGAKAYVVRIVHGEESAADDAGVARGHVAGARTRSGDPMTLRARDEGEWGNRLRARIAFRTRPLHVASAAGGELTLSPDAVVPAGSLLRLTSGGGARAFRFVASSRLRGRADGPGRELVASLDLPVLGAPARAEVVEATLEVDDGDGRVESFDGLGLSPLHARGVAAVLDAESDLVRPTPDWVDSDLVPADDRLRVDAGEPPAFQGGLDRYHEITPDDYFDPAFVTADDECDRGVHVLAGIDELSLLVVPDLYSPRPLDAVLRVDSPPTLAGPEFAPCVDAPPPTEPTPRPLGLEGLQLDPQIPADLEAITDLHRRLVDFAETRRSFVVLLDVPPRLRLRQILAWRDALRSSYAAAYHPWLSTSVREDGRDDLILLNPSAVAAGLVARREREEGVPHGPANVVARDIVSALETVPPDRHDEFHQAGINVFLGEPRGVRLTGARTLSADADYRQLSVRRLVTMIARTLEREMQWAVFEPDGIALRSEVKRLVEGWLRRLYAGNAFTGASEEEAFFVRRREPASGEGRLEFDVGIAPAEPLEFLILRIVRDLGTSLTVET